MPKRNCTAWPTTVAIFSEETRVAAHSRGEPGSRTTIDAHLPEHRRNLRHRSQDYREQRASALGAEVATFLGEVFDSDNVLSQLRTVQASVTDLEKFPSPRAQAACGRARFYRLLEGLLGARAGDAASPRLGGAVMAGVVIGAGSTLIRSRARSRSIWFPLVLRLDQLVQVDAGAT